MDSLKSRLLLGLTGYGLIIGAILAAVLHSYFPGGLNWSWFIGVFMFFLAVESLILNIVVNNSYSKDSRRLVNIYMLAKVIKILSSLSFALIYYLVEGSSNIKVFLIVLIAFYLLFLVAETYLLTKIEKHIKSDNQNEEKTI